MDDIEGIDDDGDVGNGVGGLTADMPAAIRSPYLLRHAAKGQILVLDKYCLT